MPVSVILEASEEVKQEAKKHGFEEKIVLIRYHNEEQSKAENELFSLHPYQFLVADYWGAMPPD